MKSPLSNLQSFIQLTKPRLTLMATAMVLSSFYLGSPAILNTTLLFHTLVGAFLTGAGINSLNQFLEKREDAVMKRTEKRPLVQKTLTERSAQWFGILLSVSGMGYLFLKVNGAAGFAAVLTSAIYLFLYTPLKKHSAFNTLIGAAAGAMPVWIGWTGTGSSWQNKGAWVLFAILFFWQLPHFLAIAWVYREDYKAGGFRMVTLGDAHGKPTARLILFASAALFLSSLLPTVLNITGLLYLSAAIISGPLFLALAYDLVRRPMVLAKPFVPASIFYLSVLNIFMLFDKR
jgi:protoheme IX farnesyltransferase